MKKMKILSLLALSVFILACSGEKEEAKPAPETPAAESTIPADKTPSDAEAQKMTEKPATETPENASITETVEKTTDKIGEELEKAGDAAKDKIDEGVEAVKEKVN